MAKKGKKHTARARIKRAVKKALARARPAVRKAKAAFRHAKPHSRIEITFYKKEFGKAPIEKHFVLHDGRRIESLYQLIDELETMGEDVFRGYVSDGKNDFANWTRDVFESPMLADQLQHIRNRMETQRAIMKHLLRDVAHVASKQHREHAKKTVEKEQQKKRDGVKLVIHEP